MPAVGTPLQTVAPVFTGVDLRTAGQTIIWASAIECRLTKVVLLARSVGAVTVAPTIRIRRGSGSDYLSGRHEVAGVTAAGHTSAVPIIGKSHHVADGDSIRLEVTGAASADVFTVDVILLGIPENATAVASGVTVVEEFGDGETSGDGPQILSGATLIDYGTAEVSAAEPEKRFRVTNDTAAPITLSSLTVPTGYQVTEGLSTTLAAGASDTFTVKMLTASAGTFAGEIAFKHGSSDFLIPVTGTVSATLLPVVEVFEGATAIADGGGPIDFGETLAGSPAVEKTFTVRNTGNAELTTSALSVPAGYTITQQLGAAIAPGAQATFKVAMQTATEGTKSGSVQFDNNDADRTPYNFSVTGKVNGPDIDVSPTQKNFGAQPVSGGPTAAQAFVITNQGAANLNILGISLAGSHPSHFNIVSDTGENPILPAGTRTIEVTFDPSSEGFRSAVLRIQSDDADESTVDVPIWGTTGTVHYVKKGATGANTGGSWPDAWNELNQIDWSLVMAGDTVLVSGGTSGFTYSGELRPSGTGGTASAPITVRASTDLGNDGPITIARNMNILAPYITLDGVSTDRLRIDPVSPQTGYAVQVGSSGNPGLGDWFELKNTRLIGRYTGSFGSLMNFWAPNGLVEGCVFDGTNYEDQIKLSGSGHYSILGNRFINLESRLNSSGTGAVHADHIQARSATGCSITAIGNWFIQVLDDADLSVGIQRAAMAFQIQRTGAGGPGGKYVFHNNVFCGTLTACNINEDITSTQGIEFLHNSCFHTRGVVLQGLATAPERAKVQIKNNIFEGATRFGSEAQIEYPDVDQEGNLFGAGITTVTGSDATGDPDWIDSDPETDFVVDFSLGGSSDADGAGVDLTALVPEDITGATRTVPVSIGAYE